MNKTIPLDVLIRTYEAMSACATADHTKPEQVRSAKLKAQNVLMPFSMALQRIVGDQRIGVTE